jgi:formiminoglutamase
VFDVGNVVPAPGNDAAALHETHARVTQAVRSVLEQSEGRLLPIAIGGGHDLTFPFVRAVIEFWSSRGRAIKSGVYFDAHLDVRPPTPPGSGMPFRALVEQCGVERLSVFGHSALVNSRAHVEWFEHHGGRFCHELNVMEPSFASFDLDVLDSSCAPGVSALNPCGWSVLEAEMFVEQLGASDDVRCFDLMELNPSHDEQGRTARVAAHLFLTFLKGLATRTGGGEDRA